MLELIQTGLVKILGVARPASRSRPLVVVRTVCRAMGFQEAKDSTGPWHGAQRLPASIHGRSLAGADVPWLGGNLIMVFHTYMS